MAYPKRLPTHGDVVSLVRRAFSILNHWLPKVHEHVVNEEPAESPDGERTQFSATRPIKEGTLVVYINGARYKPSTHYTEDSGGMGYTINFAPPTGANIVHDYEVDL